MYEHTPTIQEFYVSLTILLSMIFITTFALVFSIRDAKKSEKVFTVKGSLITATVFTLISLGGIIFLMNKTTLENEKFIEIAKNLSDFDKEKVSSILEDNKINNYERLELYDLLKESKK